jgi:hypothetical protein
MGAGDGNTFLTSAVNEVEFEVMLILTVIRPVFLVRAGFLIWVAFPDMNTGL